MSDIVLVINMILIKETKLIAAFGFFNGFASWALSILAVVIIGTILDIFLNEKKLGKSVRAVFASLSVLIIISPIPTLISGCKNFDLDSFSQEINLDKSYLNYADTLKKRALEDGLKAAFAEEGYTNIHCEINAEFNLDITINLVRLDISNMVISSSSSNINKAEKVRKLASEFLSISKDKIVILE